MNKYEMVEETTQKYATRNGHILHRIRALIDIQDRNGNVKIHAGELGGWLEREENLSQAGACWVGDDAEVYGNARIFGDAQVCDNARVYDNVRAYDNAIVCGNAQVYNSAWVNGDARVYDNAQVYGGAWVYSNARIYNNAWVYGDARICGDVRIGGNAQVAQNDHYMVVGLIGSRNGTTTFFRDAAGTIWVVCGCFFGTLPEFRKKVKETHNNSKYAKVYLMAADMAELQIDTTPISEVFL